jgi:hypothetical protein
VKANLKRWTDPLYAPCEYTENYEARMDFIFYFSGTPDQEQEDDFRKIVSGDAKVYKCFKRYLFFYADINENLDRNEGATLQFKRLLNMLAGSYDFFFNMEADVHPIRKNWLLKLMTEMLCGNPFWIKVYLCDV